MSILHANNPSNDVFWRKRWPKLQDYLALCQSPWHPLKRARPKFKTDPVIQLNCRGVPNYTRCETTSNTEELQPPKFAMNATFAFMENLPQAITIVAEWIDTYGIHHWKILEVAIESWPENLKSYIKALCTQGKNLWHQCKGRTNKRLARAK